MVERYYERLVEIREAVDAVTANNLLHEGYELLAIRNRTIFEDDREISQIVYIFGKFAAEGYESINWRQGKDFQWTFHTDKQGKEIPETHMLASKINESKDKRCRLGVWEYTLSKDGKFIIRKRIQETSSSEKNSIDFATEVFMQLHGSDKKPVSYDSFLNALVKTNRFNKYEAKRIINNMHKLGVIYEIRPGFFSSVWLG